MIGSNGGEKKRQIETGVLSEIVIAESLLNIVSLEKISSNWQYNSVLTAPIPLQISKIDEDLASKERV